MFYCFFRFADIAHSIFMHFHDVEIVIQKALPESETSHNYFSCTICAGCFLTHRGGVSTITSSEPSGNDGVILAAICAAR